MVKPLHAGLAARNGALAALLARAGMTASELALDGPQGFLHAMDSEGTELANAIEDLGTRWEIRETGITVKLYPSCAGTHPSLDAILDLRRRKKFTADDVERVGIDVDSIVPTILIYDRPATGLEGKFSLPFCAAAAVAFGRVGIDTFDADTLTNPQVMRLMSGVDMRVDTALDLGAAPLTHARVHITLRDGRVLTQEARGAKGYPEQPASDAELDAKFLACARRTLTEGEAERALGLLRNIDAIEDVRSLTAALVSRVHLL
jgi:2-methylcitrate dehydratase PrpD